MFGWTDKRRSRSYMPVGDVTDYEEKSSLRKNHRLLQITLCIGIALISLGVGYFIGGGRGPLSHREIVGRNDLFLKYFQRLLTMYKNLLAIPGRHSNPIQSFWTILPTRLRQHGSLCRYVRHCCENNHFQIANDSSSQRRIHQEPQQ